MQELKILSTLALKGVLEKMKGDFERALDARLEFRFDATQAILARLGGGESADLLILTEEAMEGLKARGSVSRLWRLGSSGVGIAVRAGAPRPDIGSAPALERSLLSARSIAHSKIGASGIYFSELLERLGLAGRLQKRIVVEKGPVGLLVASGEAELGVQQLCELAPVPGIDIVGPLPEPLQKLTWFSAGLCAGAANAPGATRLAELLRSAPARAAMAASRITPA